MHPGGYICLELQVNTDAFANGIPGSYVNYEVCSKSTIMNLKKGDKLRVVFSNGNGKLYGSNRYTGFSVFLIMLFVFEEYNKTFKSCVNELILLHTICIQFALINTKGSCILKAGPLR